VLECKLPLTTTTPVATTIPSIIKTKEIQETQSQKKSITSNIMQQKKVFLELSYKERKKM
jgi:phage-related protein